MGDILYSKLRLAVPNDLDGENAIITSAKGSTRQVEMTSPITDIMLAGMEEYRVQAGITDKNIDLGYGEFKKLGVYAEQALKKLPYDFMNGSAVVLNGEIHILGSWVSTSTRRKHYKWDGSTWVFVSTLPYDFGYGSAVVLNGEIHILGSLNNSTYKGTTNHYKWNGSSWVSVSTLPYTFTNGSAVVLNGEIHILGGSGTQTKHYKQNGSSWVSVSTIPYNIYQSSAVVLNNDIVTLGSNPMQNYDAKWNGTSWTLGEDTDYVIVEQ